MNPFLVLKLKAIVSLSYVSCPITNTGLPSILPVVSAVPVACTRLLSRFICIRSLFKSMFWYFTFELPNRRTSFVAALYTSESSDESVTGASRLLAFLRFMLSSLIESSMCLLCL